MRSWEFFKFLYDAKGNLLTTIVCKVDEDEIKLKFVPRWSSLPSVKFTTQSKRVHGARAMVKPAATAKLLQEHTSNYRAFCQTIGLYACLREFVLDHRRYRDPSCPTLLFIQLCNTLSLQWENSGGELLHSSFAFPQIIEWLGWSRNSQTAQPVSPTCSDRGVRWSAHRAVTCELTLWHESRSWLDILLVHCPLTCSPLFNISSVPYQKKKKSSSTMDHEYLWFYAFSNWKPICVLAHGSSFICNQFCLFVTCLQIISIEPIV